MNNYLEVEKKKYKFNLNNIISFVTNISDKEIKRSNVKSEQYGYPLNENTGEINLDEMSLISREVTESKDTVNETYGGVRYDIIKYLLNIVTDEKIIEFSNKNSIGFKIAFNTLLENKIIEEIK